MVDEGALEPEGGAEDSRRDTIDAAHVDPQPGRECVCERERHRERVCVCEKERVCVCDREIECACV